MYKDRAAAGGKPMTVGPGHQCVINKLAELVTVIRRHGCHLAIQAPIRIPPDSEPEPDASIVAGAPGDFIRRHPGPSEVFCVIEVADSSLVHDRTVKHRLYASARIPQYVIVNLVDRRVEVYSNPRPARGRYKDATIRTRDQAVALSVGPGRKPVILRAKELLPYSGESVKR
jgi:Uma2 family endonuclease